MKNIYREPDGTIRVSDIHPLYGDLNRGASKLESLQLRTKEFASEILQAVGAIPVKIDPVRGAIPNQNVNAERFVTFKDNPDGSWDIAFDPAVPPANTEE